MLNQQFFYGQGVMLVNGLPQEHVSLSERALNYGDGVFETIRLHRGRPILFSQHIKRLQKACEVLGLNCNFELLSTEIYSLQDRFKDFGILKILISRGAKGRGYRVEPNIQATRILSLHPLPDYSAFDAEKGVEVFVCEHRLSTQGSTAGIKHLNRLDQVLASREWPDELYFEGLMRDQQGYVMEGTRTNLFFAEAGRLVTPALLHCGVEGILRAYLLDEFSSEAEEESELPLERLLQADELFLCNSVIGVWSVSSVVLSGKRHEYSSGHFCQRAQAIFAGVLDTDAVD